MGIKNHLGRYGRDDVMGVGTRLLKGLFKRRCPFREFGEAAFVEQILTVVHDAQVDFIGANPAGNQGRVIEVFIRDLLQLFILQEVGIAIGQIKRRFADGICGHIGAALIQDGQLITRIDEGINSVIRVDHLTDKYTALFTQGGGKINFAILSIEGRTRQTSTYVINLHDGTRAAFPKNDVGFITDMH